VLAALLSVTACAEAYESGDDEAPDDGGARAPELGQVPLPLVDAGTSDAATGLTVGTVPPGGCVPGQCLTCDAEGRVALPPDDSTCPSLACNTLNARQLRREGPAWICENLVYLGAEARCERPGVCRAPGDAAGCGTPRVLLDVRTEETCRVIEGCQGQTPGTVAPAPPGEPCGGAGICRADGTCDASVAEGCGLFGGAMICDDGVHVNGDPYCDLAVADGSTCAATCAAYGSVCLAAFAAEAGAPCAEGGPVGCVTAQPHLRCRCRN
jgi:hypothetical protein